MTWSFVVPLFDRWTAWMENSILYSSHCDYPPWIHGYYFVYFSLNKRIPNKFFKFTRSRWEWTWAAGRRCYSGEILFNGHRLAAAWKSIDPDHKKNKFSKKPHDIPLGFYAHSFCSDVPETRKWRNRQISRVCVCVSKSPHRDRIGGARWRERGRHSLATRHIKSDNQRSKSCVPSFPSFLNFVVPCVDFSFPSIQNPISFSFFINLFQFRRNVTKYFQNVHSI